MIRRLLPDEIAVAECDPRGVSARPAHIARYLAGRAVAYAGADSLPAFTNDRNPRWPRGYVGAVLHSRQWCAAAAAPTSERGGIALDARRDLPLPVHHWPSVFIDRERAWLMARVTGDRDRIAGLLAAAKQTAHRAQYSVSRAYVGPHGLAVELDLSRCRWTARILRPVGSSFAPGDAITGGFDRYGDLILSAATAPARAREQRASCGALERQSTDKIARNDNDLIAAARESENGHA